MSVVNSRSGFFLGLSGLAFATMTGLGLKLAVVQDPHTYLNQCSPSTLRYFQAFPAGLRSWLCTLYTAIQVSPSHPGAYTLFSQLVRMGSIFMPIVALESHRQTRFWAKRGIDFFLLLAQGLSGAVSIPLFFSTVSAGTSAERAEIPKIGPEQGWTVFASTLFGYLLPLAYGVRTQWSNKAITNFLFFPIYFIVLNRLLPYVLARFQTLRDLPAALPIRLIVTVASILSADGHFKMLLSRIGLKRIFWPFSSEPSTTRDLHILLTHDYVFCLMALTSFVLLYCHGSKSREEKLRVLRRMLIQAVLFGPTAAIALAWSDSITDEDFSTVHTQEANDERRRLLNDRQEN